MIILPAIDILGGNCVRLKKGEYGTAEKVADDPKKAIDEFAECGAEYVHLVDLDGAKEGKAVNSELICSLVKYAYERYGIFCELGGGIRSMETVCTYLDNGLGRVILGSAALHNPQFVENAVKEYGNKISVGIDALDGYVKTSGWLEGSNAYFTDMALEMEKVGVKNIIFTDISRDGMLSGPNLEQLRQLKETVSIDITASGGIKNIDDIKALNEMDLYGVICGKSIYQGTLSLSEAIKISK